MEPTTGQERIVCDPDIMFGKAVIGGTRITVESILERLGAGESMEQILSSHPRLTREGLQSALTYAASALRSEVVVSWAPRAT